MKGLPEAFFSVILPTIADCERAIGDLQGKKLHGNAVRIRCPSLNKHERDREWTLFIKPVQTEVSNDQIRGFFSGYDIIKIERREKKPGKLWPWCRVTLFTLAEAERAIAELDRKQFLGWTESVRISFDRKRFSRLDE